MTKLPHLQVKTRMGKRWHCQITKGKSLYFIFIQKPVSPTCTIESCNLRDNYSLLKKNGFEVLGVSPDTEEKQKKFKIKYKLPFPLMADAENKVTGTYGVHDMKKLFGGNIWEFPGHLL